MTLMEKVCCSLAAALWIATATACGGPAERRDAAEQAPAADPPPSASGDAAGGLPALVAPGVVAQFEAAPADVGARKSRDTTGSLPSNVAVGRSAAYAPAGRAGDIGIAGTAGQVPKP